MPTLRPSENQRLPSRFVKPFERLPSSGSAHNVSSFIKIANLPVRSLVAELEAAPEMWERDTSRQRKVRCQRHTRNIFLRTARKPLPPGAKNANDVHESCVFWMADRFPRALACCERIAQWLGAELGRATLVALMPHGDVYPHVDAGDYYRIRDRYHLVLKSRVGSVLSAGDETVIMREGELWVFDNKVRHAAKNPSTEPRVHLIFDVLPAVGRGHFVRPLRAMPVERPASRIPQAGGS